MSSLNFCIVTLGCKVNQYESQALREAWTASGWTETAQPDAAAVVLVNSCAVTAKAVADVRSAVRRLQRQAPRARILVAGCAAQSAREELQELSGVVLLDQAAKARLFSRPLAQAVPDGLPDAAPVSDAAPLFPPYAISGYDRSRAVVKVQDGCSHRCTYCIVPASRGPARSRPVRAVLDEARRLLEAGFRELVLSGVNLRQYRDAEDPAGDFWSLLERLEAELGPEWAGVARLRISSLEPGQLHARALDVLANSRLTAPHLHISLQSGSASVLRRMGRGHYNPDQILEFTGQLRHIWPVFGLGADILTGFPGETDEEHTATVALCARLPFSYAHVFPYSRRPGTAAASMKGQVPGPLKKERAATLRGLMEKKQREFLQRMLGCSRMRVALEQAPEPRMSPSRQSSCAAPAHGVNEYYVDCVVDCAADLSDARRLLTVRPAGVEGTRLRVEPATDGERDA